YGWMRRTRDPCTCGFDRWPFDLPANRPREGHHSFAFGTSGMPAILNGIHKNRGGQSSRGHSDLRCFVIEDQDRPDPRTQGNRTDNEAGRRATSSDQQEEKMISQFAEPPRSMTAPRDPLRSKELSAVEGDVRVPELSQKLEKD